MLLDSRGRRLRRQIGFLLAYAAVVEPTCDLDVDAVSDRILDIPPDTEPCDDEDWCDDEG